MVLTAEAGEKQVSVCGADGRMGDALTLYSGYSSNPFGMQEPMQRAAADDSGKNACVRMDGQAIFRFAVRKVPQLIEELLQKNSLQKEDIKYYILHQANSRIIQSVAKRLKEPEEKFPMNLSLYGNTSAASIPILLDEMNRNGMLNRGDKLVLSGFGAGLTWGAVLLEW